MASRSPPMAPYITVVVLFTTISAVAAATGYRNHTVGGTAGWFFNATSNTSATNYSSWASTQTFSLGDYLIFNTNSNQSVILTYNKTSYLNCTTDDSDNDTFIYSSESYPFNESLTFPVPLTIVGPNYFFSDANEGVQCQHGLAFEIEVQHGLGLPPSLNQPPPPPYIEPPGPDSAQSPPITVAQPPNSGGFARSADLRVVIYGLGAALLVLQFW
ncbi:early nodulin-like protein 18 [Cicer arietinum]|uniref:Cucumber peeling cupredoxin-like n=1 Tax=Cicer arietinum TaxID=3827 RepID=A0A1S2XPU1_CICAR|nr:cucumber peeling cupredoxin-like [Cicer arietinum]